MRLFLFFYLVVYGGMIAYSLRKIHVAFACGWRGGALLALGGVLVLAAPFLLQRLSGEYAYVETGRVRLKIVEVPTPRLAPGVAPLRILQIADLHLGRTSRPAVLDTVLRLVREARPDLLLSSGDLVDAADPAVGPAMQRFAKIRPPLGKLAVLGNHEVYPGANRTTRLFETGGFAVLRDTAVPVGNQLLLAGVDDPAVLYAGDGKALAADESMILPQSRDGRFVLFLKHEPRVTDSARARADLQLSGHTHQGQIFPFGWFVRLFYPYPHGKLLAFPEGLRLYVSPGAGTWGPPFRVFARPDVTLFVLTPAAAP